MLQSVFVPLAVLALVCKLRTDDVAGVEKQLALESLQTAHRDQVGVHQRRHHAAGSGGAALRAKGFAESDILSTGRFLLKRISSRRSPLRRA
jgi:hypothetical protein